MPPSRGCAGDEGRSTAGDGTGRRWPAGPDKRTDSRALPPIRTFTVGSGFTPDQPVDGFDRVAGCRPFDRVTAGSDFHRAPPARGGYRISLAQRVRVTRP